MKTKKTCGGSPFIKVRLGIDSTRALRKSLCSGHWCMCQSLEPELVTSGASWSVLKWPSASPPAKAGRFKVTRIASPQMQPDAVVAAVFSVG